MFLNHLVVADAAGKHASIEIFKVNVVHMPGNNGQHSQQGFAAVGSLAGRDKLAGQKFGGGNRIPQYKAGHNHNDSAPDHGPILKFFGKAVAAHLGLGFGQPQVVSQSMKTVLRVLPPRQHGGSNPQYKDFVGQQPAMVNSA